jgi:dUTP pyrophosphatase
MILNIKKLHDDSVMPSYGSEFAAGLDLCSYIDCDVPAGTRKLIPTGISVSWDQRDSYIRIAPRSGLSVKHSIDIGAGVVDFDYRGELFVCFINNHKTDSYAVKKGDRIAQMIFTKIGICDEIRQVEEHSSTERGSGGFGSTGK